MKNFSFISGLIIYMLVWLLLLLWFWTGLPQDGAMLYSMISFYLVLPVASAVISGIWAARNTWSIWLLPAFFGCMAMFLSYFTFDLANTLAFHKIHSPDIKMALFSAVPSLAGLCISTFILVIRKNK